MKYITAQYLRPSILKVPYNLIGILERTPYIIKCMVPFLYCDHQVGRRLAIFSLTKASANGFFLEKNCYIHLHNITYINLSYSFTSEQPLHTEKLFHISDLHREAFTHRSFYTEKPLHRQAFTHRSFYTQKLLHTEAFTQKSLYAEERLHTEAFTQRQMYAQKPLHTDKIAHRLRIPQW